MNQDNYLEEAYKMRNLLEELLKYHSVQRPTILGLREHIFTGSVSSLAWFMTNQETSFVTVGQQLLANPLKDAHPTLQVRQKKSDAREMQSFYQQYYEKYVKAIDSATDQADRVELAKAYQTARVLFEVLKAVNQTEAAELEPKIMEANKEVEKKNEMYIPYNILPLDTAGALNAIMQFPKIKAAVAALRNTRGLPQPENWKKLGTDYDLFDWLQAVFGFQKDNVANQREHLILLLTNVHIRHIPKPEPLSKLAKSALTEVMEKLCKNYKK